MGWTVKYNHLGAVAEELPDRIGKEVQNVADEMVLQLKSTLWIDTGLVRRVTTVDSGQDAGADVDAAGAGMHAQIDVGYNRGHGFYSRFNEWGTIKQAARPIVGPTAEAFRPRFAQEMGQGVAEACEAQ
jgi:HK97 gp10 family phage protein